MAWCLHLSFLWEWNHLPKTSPSTIWLHPIDTDIQGNQNRSIHRRCVPHIPPITTLQLTSSLDMLAMHYDCSWIRRCHCCPNGVYFHSWLIVASVCFSLLIINNICHAASSYDTYMLIVLLGIYTFSDGECLCIYLANSKRNLHTHKQISTSLI
jgi:hypothetical protein